VHACDRRVAVISAPAPLNWPAWNRLRWNNTLFNSLCGGIPYRNAGRSGRQWQGHWKWKRWTCITKLFKYKCGRIAKLNIHPSLWWRNGLAERCRLGLDKWKLAVCCCYSMLLINELERWNMNVNNWSNQMMENSKAMVSWSWLCCDTVIVRHWRPAREP
jgi:hypothetical protein